MSIRQQYVCSLSETTSLTWDSEVALSEVAKGRDARKLINHMFYAYIHILLINTNSTIYICCIKYKDKVGICVLAVRDNELDVGDSEVASSEVAKGRDARKSCG